MIFPIAVAAMKQLQNIVNPAVEQPSFISLYMIESSES